MYMQTMCWRPYISGINLLADPCSIDEYLIKQSYQLYTYNTTITLKVL